MISDTANDRLDFGNTTILRGLSVPQLIELALARREGVLATNGALAVGTGDRTGRSPKDKFLEDTPTVHDQVDWGATNQPISPAHFAELEELARYHLSQQEQLFRFDGYSCADLRYRRRVTVIAEKAWHALFAKTLFINAEPAELAGFEPDWLVINASELRVHTFSDYGLNSGVAILQSLEQRKVVILGSHYAGEMKKSIFYAMNHELPGRDVLPMHCSCNVDQDDPDNVALFFGLSGTGKTTLSADPARPLIGDDEHGWSDQGVFNLEGGCYAKCLHLTREGEPQIWDAIRFGSVLENVVLDSRARTPDYDDGSRTENTRVTYPVQHIPNAITPSLAGHPKNVLFLTADAFGVLPPVSKLTREQAMYYFVNGYTSKLAGTEAGVGEPTPNFSPCYGGPFLPRPPMVYAELLARRIEEHDTDVWLLNTGWTGGPHGVGRRFEIAYTRAFVSAILDGSLHDASYEEHPIFGLRMPTDAPGVPRECLNPRNTWADPDAYDQAAEKLAKLFRENEARFEIADAVRRAGPRV
ncbi:MAG: phosphoenolpyruvate carboxykinase (ATP) [Myxococcota bacterium]|nr:phosphoenolpyruvate carboxykinase (ATP) [Myxococcota bacterium]